MSSPRVSIVTATFNRSNILRYTIESVLAQTFSNWELIVVGDACTDDTEQVVASFGDPRIRFVNLPVNAGEQSVPNNDGVRLARGEYIAFVNHDDLWISNHLATCLDAIGDADLVSTVTMAIDHDGTVHLTGVCASGEYEPETYVPASSWLLRRTLAESVGPWRRAREIYLTPSQEWLFRARKQGRRLRSIANPTVIAVLSGTRKRAYADRQEAEHVRLAERLRNDPLFVQDLLLKVAYRMTAEANAASPIAHFKRALKALVRWATLATGVHPHSLRNAVLFGRKGAFVDSLRKNRGLAPLPRGRTT